MIEGLQIEMSSAELKSHCDALSRFHAEYAERLMYILETRLTGAKQEVTTLVRETITSRQYESKNWAAVALAIPENEVHRFAVDNYGTASAIQWPIHKMQSDNELVAVFTKHAEQHVGGLANMLRGLGIPVVGADGHAHANRNPDEDPPSGEGEGGGD